MLMVISLVLGILALVYRFVLVHQTSTFRAAIAL